MKSLLIHITITIQISGSTESNITDAEMLIPSGMKKIVKTTEVHPQILVSKKSA